MPLKLMLALAALAPTVLAGPAAALERPNEARDMMRAMGMKGLSPKKLAKAIAKAERSPLGSKANPIRENMPQGELDYLRRLRCPDGSAPASDRKGNIGAGVYGNIIDLYTVTCPGSAAVEVHMDMYHDGPEKRPIPGFTIVPADDA